MTAAELAFDLLLGDRLRAGIELGHPRVEVEATAGARDLFRHLDRGRIDSLLGMAWLVTAPEGR